jgi:enterochelin esterase-like enzyme
MVWLSPPTWEDALVAVPSDGCRARPQAGDSVEGRHVKILSRAATRRAVTAVVAGVTLLSTAGATTPQRAAQPGQPGQSRQSGPVVQHTKRGPTGYEVTFRYYAPRASRVQIKGEWSFERPSELAQRASTPGNLVQTPGLLPAQWKPGDVPMQSPNSTDPNFPVADMLQVGRSGMWTYTTPLPSGVFTYGFFVDCQAAGQVGCTQLPDPGNPAWRGAAPVPVSTVYVPSDPRFGTVDYSWQAPAPKQGNLVHVSYDSPDHLTPLGKNNMVIYTPPGYDAKRKAGYPTLYLSHGGGENEMGWSVQGNLRNIMDNLIRTGEIQPMLVVMPYGSGYVSSANNQAYRTDLAARIIPWVERHYNADPAAAKRAFSGLSFGGQVTNQLMLNDTATFGYYGMMSAGLPPGTTLTDAQVAALKKVQVFVGTGWQDSIFADGYTVGDRKIHTGPAEEVRTLTKAGIHVTTSFVDGGHEWYVWRILLRDFLTRVAFLPSPEATW